MFSINQNYQESVSYLINEEEVTSLALIKITKSPYLYIGDSYPEYSLALIKITKSPYLYLSSVFINKSLALIKITKSPYLLILNQ